MEEKTMVFDREQLYKEIWQLTLTKVAKKHGIPYPALRAACQTADIPLPTNTYWGSLYSGKSPEITPLPVSSLTEVTVRYGVRNHTEPKTTAKPQPKPEKKAATENAQTSSSASQDTAMAEEKTEEKPAPPPKTADGRNLYERKVLYEEVWQEPVTKVAVRYGVSDVMIHKMCKALAVPVPPRGYWAKKAAGQTVKKEPLPPYTGKEVLLGNRPDTSQRGTVPPPDEDLGFLDADEKQRVLETALEVRIDPDKRKLHPVLMQHKAARREWAKQNPLDPFASLRRDSYRHIPEGEPAFYMNVSTDTWPRLYHILDALFLAIETLGGSINADLSVHIRGEHVKFTVTEGQTQVAHVLTKAEQNQLKKYEKEKQRYSYAYEPRFRKYDYIPTGRLTFSARRGHYVRDAADGGLENRIGEILLDLYTESETVRLEREAKEAAERKAEEEKRQRELRRQRYNEEVDRLAALKRDAADYRTACELRVYITAVEAMPDPDEDRAEWIAWAKAKADWYDPLIRREDPIFGKRDPAQPNEPQKIERRWW